jgi:hypothetical protein
MALDMLKLGEMIVTEIVLMFVHLIINWFFLMCDFFDSLAGFLTYVSADFLLFRFIKCVFMNNFSWLDFFLLIKSLG